jgi:hypothetical protein
MYASNRKILGIVYVGDLGEIQIEHRPEHFA